MVCHQSHYLRRGRGVRVQGDWRWSDTLAWDVPVEVRAPAPRGRRGGGSSDHIMGRSSICDPNTTRVSWAVYRRLASRLPFDTVCRMIGRSGHTPIGWSVVGAYQGDWVCDTRRTTPGAEQQVMVG